MENLPAVAVKDRIRNLAQKFPSFADSPIQTALSAFILFVLFCQFDRACGLCA